MKYTVKISNKFKKDFRRCMKRGLKMKLITDAMDILASNGSLPAQYHPHKLINQTTEIWECHIQPDWLMTSLFWGDAKLLLLLHIHFDYFGTHR